jgi:hypothetical protein
MDQDFTSHHPAMPFCLQGNLNLFKNKFACGFAKKGIPKNNFLK